MDQNHLRISENPKHRDIHLENRHIKYIFNSTKGKDVTQVNGTGISISSDQLEVL